MSLLQLRRYEFTFVRGSSLFLKVPPIREPLESLSCRFSKNQVFRWATIFFLPTLPSVSIRPIRPLLLATFPKWLVALLLSALRLHGYFTSSLLKKSFQSPLLTAPKW